MRLAIKYKDFTELNKDYTRIVTNPEIKNVSVNREEISINVDWKEPTANFLSKLNYDLVKRTDDGSGKVIAMKQGNFYILGDLK